MRHLFAWENDTLIGRFDEKDGRVTFSYERDASYPISLSLPLEKSWSAEAPAAFLDGLLPEEEARRVQMMGSIGARSTDAFDLLDSVDSTGGLVFTSTPEAPVTSAGAAIATEMDIEAQMQRIYDSDTAWWSAEKRNRFSLAGNQAKFSLSNVDGLWFWPNASLPSTHILKPNGPMLPDVATVEHTTMEIARCIGISTSDTQIVTYGSREGLLVKRFDRTYNSQTKTIRRIRTEDMTQALGAWNKDKYDFEISELVACLHKAGASEEVLYALVRQIAFNACIGNHDAHAKNYSVILEPDGIHLAPLYDSICMAHWPQFKNDVLAMPVNGVYDPWEVTIDDWRTEAKTCGLDSERVEEIVRNTVTALWNFDYETLPCDVGISLEICD